MIKFDYYFLSFIKKTKLKIMIRIYSEAMHKRDDEEYIIMKLVVCGLFICSVMCIGLIILITSVIDEDGSY
jgi:hypothetical protein